MTGQSQSSGRSARPFGVQAVDMHDPHGPAAHDTGFHRRQKSAYEKADTRNAVTPSTVNRPLAMTAQTGASSLRHGRERVHRASVAARAAGSRMTAVTTTKSSVTSQHWQVAREPSAERGQ